MNVNRDADRRAMDPRAEAVRGDDTGAGSARSRLKVFLSHSSADKELARRLAHDLQSANVEVWLDQWQIGVGEAFEQRIARGLDETDFVLVLLTRTSIASDWVDREWREKVEHEARTRRVAILPVRAESCAIPDFLAQRSHADISGGSYLLGFRHLLDLLRHYGNEAPLQRPDEAFAVEARRRTAHLLEIERSLLGLPEAAPALQIMLPVTTPIALEVAYDLIPLFEPDAKGRSRALDELVPAVRAALQAQFGFSFPGISIHGNQSDMASGSALVLIDEIPEEMLRMDPGNVLVHAPVERLSALGIAAQAWRDPQGGGNCACIARADRDSAVAAGLPCMDAAEYILHGVHQVVQRHASSFLDIDVVRGMVKAFEATAPDLVARTVPSSLSWIDLTEVLRGLVDEEVSISDLGAILEALAPSDPTHRNVAAWVEQARHALRARISASFAPDGAALRVLRLDPRVEALVGAALQQSGAGSYLALTPTLTQDLLAVVREQMTRLGRSAAGVVMLTEEAMLRPYFRRLVRMEFPALHVLSTRDVQPGTPLQVVAAIALPESGGGAA